MVGKYLSLFLCLIVSIKVLASPLDSIVVKNFEPNTSIIDFFDEISKENNIDFYYKTEWFANDTISLNLNNQQLSDALSAISKKRAYTYKTIQNHIVFFPKEVIIKDDNRQSFSSSQQVKTRKVIGRAEDIGKSSKAKVTGTVVDGKTGEPLLGSTIAVKGMNLGAASNVSGIFTMVVKPGVYTFTISSIGYQTVDEELKILASGEIKIELFEESVSINEVAVYAKRADQNVRSNQMSVVHLDAKTIKSLPIVVGETDIIKSFTAMPGVKSVGEFGSGINVRGGGEDQNLYLLEGAPIFNTSHIMGLISVVNPDAVNNVTLYKGHIPANMGERVSSVMDIDLKTKNEEKTSVVGGIGIFSSKLLIKAPVLNGNSSFKVGGRSSYSDYLLRQSKDLNLRNSNANFYDLNASLNLNFGNNNVSLFGYRSFDNFQYWDLLRYEYGNQLVSLKWSHLFSSRLNTNMVLAYSNYHNQQDNTQSEYSDYQKNTDLKYYTAKLDVNYNPAQGHEIIVGAQTILYNVNMGSREPLGNASVIDPVSLDPEKASENAFYTNYLFDINSNISLSTGLRYSLYTLLGPYDYVQYKQGVPLDAVYAEKTTPFEKNEQVISYKNWEPRVSLKFQVDSVSSLKLSYNKNYQYLSLLSYTSVPTPDDIWKLSDPYLSPIECNQMAIGYFRNFSNNTIETSVEVYYKTFEHLVEYKNDARIELNQHMETELIDAEGRNYGFELMVKKNKGKIDGWVSYTWSRSFKKSHGVYSGEIINNNEFFPSSYDKPHDLTVVANYNLNKRVVFSANFSYMTGRSVTLPVNEYDLGFGPIKFYSDRNAYRLPDYHRLDVSISINESIRIRKKWKGRWVFSLLNVYARKNAYSIFYKKATPSYDNDFKAFSLYKLYIIGQPLPTLTYNFIF